MLELGVAAAVGGAVCLIVVLVLCGKKKQAGNARSAVNQNYLDEIPVSNGLFVVWWT
jgi:hypothetical protein